LIVRKHEKTEVRRLRSRAAAEGVSMEEAHRRVLRKALLGDPAPARKNFVEYLRAMPDVELQVDRARDLPRDVAF
jgi:plasmid stability protein